MRRVITQRLAGLGLAAIMTLTAAGGAVAVFSAGGPGENLSPRGAAERLIELSQVGNSIVWGSMAGNVSLIETTGWSSTDGTNELGGAMVIERPDDPVAGSLDIGEKPHKVKFTFD